MMNIEHLAFTRLPAVEKACWPKGVPPGCIAGEVVVQGGRKVRYILTQSEDKPMHLCLSFAHERHYVSGQYVAAMARFLGVVMQVELMAAAVGHVRAWRVEERPKE